MEIALVKFIAIDSAINCNSYKSCQLMRTKDYFFPDSFFSPEAESEY
jgi:hypothetical protein